MSHTRAKYSIKTDFTTLSLTLIPVAAAVNFAGGQIATNLKLPFYIDTIGTILTAMLCGPWVGALAGLVSNLLIGITDPIFFPFAAVNVAVGLVTGFCARKNGFRTWLRRIASVLLMSLASIIVAAPISVLLFGGVTNTGASLFTATMLAAGANIWSAVLSTEIIFTALDRVISIVLTWLVIKSMPTRTLVRFPCGESYTP